MADIAREIFARCTATPRNYATAEARTELDKLLRAEMERITDQVLRGNVRELLAEYRRQLYDRSRAKPIVPVTVPEQRPVGSAPVVPPSRPEPEPVVDFNSGERGSDG